MRRAGYSLVDVFLAILIVSTIFFALATVCPVSLASMRKSSTRLAACNLARQYLETWRQQPFDTVATLAAPVTYSDTLEGVTYLSVVSVRDPQPAVADCKTIAVTVTWDSGGALARQNQVEYDTCIYNVLNP